MANNINVFSIHVLESQGVERILKRDILYRVSFLKDFDVDKRMEISNVRIFYPNFDLNRLFFALLMDTVQVPFLPFLAVNLESLAVEGGDAGGGLAVHGRQQHHRHQQQQQHPERIRKVVRGGWRYKDNSNTATNTCNSILKRTRIVVRVGMAVHGRQQHRRHQQHKNSSKRGTWQ
jgi:hypothetical protein